MIAPATAGQRRWRNVDLQSLEQALLVTDQGSFRGAARVLKVRPSVVARRIRSLEDRIGVSLFQRQSLGVVPTPAGKRLLARAANLLDDFDALLRIAHLNGSADQGSLRLGTICSLAGGTLRGILVRFMESHPGVDVSILEGVPRDHLAAVASLRMDATFVVGEPSTPGCERDLLWSERIYLAIPATHRLGSSMQEVNWTELGDELFIVSKTDPSPELEDFVVAHLSSLGRRPTVEPRPVYRDGLLALVGLGFGLGLVGEAEAAVVYPNVVYRPLQDGALPFSIVWSDKNDNPAFRRFLSLCRLESKQLGRGPLNDRGIDAASGKHDPQP